MTYEFLTKFFLNVAVNRPPVGQLTEYVLPIYHSEFNIKPPACRLGLRFNNDYVILQ